MIALKEVNLILQIIWTIILRCGRQKSNIGVCACIRANLLYQLVKRLIHQCVAVAELMTLINNNESIILVLKCSLKFTSISTVIVAIFPTFILGNISDSSCCYEVNVWRNLLVRIFVEHGNSLLPTRLNGRRSNDQHLTFSTIIFWYGKKTLDDKRSNDCLTKSNHVSQHKTTMFAHNAKTSFDGFYLIFQFVNL